MAPLSRGVMSVFCNVIKPQGLEPFQFSTKISSPSRTRGAGTRRSIPLRGPRRGSFGALSDSAASSNTTRERRNDGRYHSVSCHHPPVRPYLAWAKRDDTTDIAEQVFEDLRRAPHVYLLPEYGDADSEREILDDFWPDLFAAMLNCRLTDEQQ